MAFQNTPEFLKIREDYNKIQKDFSEAQSKSKVFSRGFFNKFNYQKPSTKANQGELLRTGQFNVGGKNITFNEKKGRSGRDYEFILPDGQKVAGSSRTAIGHSSTYGLINKMLRKAVGGEAEKLGFLGMNASQGFDSNIQELARLRGLDPNTFLTTNPQGQAPTAEQQAINQAGLMKQTGLKPTDTYADAVKAGAIGTPGEKVEPITADKKVSVKNAKGETILVYESSIPDLVKEGVIPKQGTTKADDGAMDIKAVSEADTTPVIQKSAEMNAMKERVLASIENAPQKANSLANDAFIQSVAQAKFGRPASEDELKHVSEGGMLGASLRDVMTAFGLSGDLPDMGVTDEGIEWKAGISDDQKQSVRDLMQKPRSEWTNQDILNYNFATDSSEKPIEAPTPTTGGTTGADTTGGGATGDGGGTETTTTDPISNAYNSLITSKQEGGEGAINIDPMLQAKQNAEMEVEKARQLIADKQLLDAEELESMSKDQPIPMSTIRRQQAQFTQDEYINNLMNAQDYNNKLILSQIANGNLLEARNINQQIAQDNFEIKKLQIDKMVAENAIDQQQAESLYKQSEHELKLQDGRGYTPLDTQESINNAITQFGASRVWKDPVSGKSYLKPEDTSKDLQFVSGTKTQQSGYFNKKTGEFTPLGGDISAQIGGGGAVGQAPRGAQASVDESGKPLDAGGKFTDDVELGFNEKIDINKIPELGGKQITNKTARQGNLPFGVTDKQADWIIQHRAGNVQFQQLKSSEFEKLADLFELREDINEIRALKEKVNTGPVASKLKKAGRFFGQEDTNYNELEVKSGKQLANFIKEISGAAVSEPEAQRLARLVPNVNMQDGQFKVAVNDLEDDLNNLINAKINQYDLFDEEELRKAVFGGRTSQPTVTNEGQSADDILSEFGIQ